MKHKNILVIIIILSVLISYSMISSETEKSENLVKGKNSIKLNLTNPFYVTTLIKLNPEIEVVSYKSQEGTIGYVDIYGGIGKDFIIETGREYEVIVSSNISLVIPSQKE